jgi:hypothetical protein
MALILSSLKRAIDDGIETSLPTSLVDQACRDLGYVFRHRLLTPAVTLQLFCLQILHGNTAITHLRQLSGIEFSVSSYSEARSRLPLELIQALLERMTLIMRESAARIMPPALFGRRLVLVDSVSFSMPDTPQLVKYFGLPPGQKPGIGYPVGKAMALLDYATGMLTTLLSVHQFVHDMRGVIGLHPALKKGDILLGDTAFCSFVHVCLLAQLGVDAIFRLHQRRPKSAGTQRWKKPPKRPSWMTQEQYDSLPAFVDVRVIKHHVAQKGYRTRIVFIATTLMDEEAWPDWLLAEIYRRRWEIEVCFDHLKTTMNMSVLKCKTVDGVLKELAVFLLVYNRIRLAMIQTAARLGVNVMLVSFIDIMRKVGVNMIGLPGVEKIIVNPRRPGRHQPRVRRRRPKEYPSMTKPRSELKKALFAA